MPSCLNFKLPVYRMPCILCWLLTNYTVFIMYNVCIIKRHNVNAIVFAYAIVFILCRIGKQFSVDGKLKRNMSTPFSYENGKM